MIRTAKRQKFDKSAFFTYVKKNYRSILFFALFFIGMIIGAMLIRNAPGETLDNLASITGGFVDKRAQQSFADTLISSFMSNSLYLMLLFIFGFCAIAQPFITAVPLFKGLGLGFSIGYFYAYYKLQGLLYVLLIILPGALITTAVVIAACNQAYSLSLIFLRGINPNNNKSPNNQPSITIKKYMMRYVFFLVVILVSSSFEAICSSLFGRFFSF
ncbi:stage II sporulation protein M [Candidatus Soleaferrea massiliensis]|uniref:stage II sporulation protein M n=1 Tax=Candidatus Soleaferrea massiliensis TaxID=1470354 RepID=UPI00058DD7B2|nr:stage II sporulation protein M [Candidatus Soleaferrea massiliensis]